MSGQKQNISFNILSMLYMELYGHRYIKCAFTEDPESWLRPDNF